MQIVMGTSEAQINFTSSYADTAIISNAGMESVVDYRAFDSNDWYSVLVVNRCYV